MSQLNVYVPEKIEKEVRKKAKAQGKSLSAYLVDVIRSEVCEEEWQPNFFTKVIGGWQGDFSEVPRTIPEPLENL